MNKLSYWWSKLSKKTNNEISIIENNIVTESNSDQLLSHPKYIDFYKKHRIHQSESIISTKGSNIGQLTLPTGTGKTRIQLAVHLEELIKLNQINESGVFVIVAHRLALCNQLICDFIKLVTIDLNMNCDYLYVSSDNFNANRVIKTLKSKHGLSNKNARECVKNCNFKSTTTQEEIKAIVESSKSANRHTIIVSTYDSFDRLKVLNSIDVCTFDESHTIPNNSQFVSNINSVKPIIKRQFFFTATRKVSGEYGGMNDQSFYGNVLHQVSPRRMIEAGEIVIPNNYQIIKVSNDEGFDYKNPVMVRKTIVEGFKKHFVAVKEHSCSPDKIGAKLLVSCDGANQLDYIVNDQAFQLWAYESNINVICFSTYPEKQGYIDIKNNLEFKTENRNTLLEKLYDLSDSDNAILLHVDILAEGIDLPCITGILLMRELDSIKLIQTLGRATRLIDEDRKNFYSGKIGPNQSKKMIKPYAWILLPEYLLADSKILENTINSVYEDYNVRPDHYMKGDNYVSDPKYDLPALNSPDEIQRKVQEGELSQFFKMSPFLGDMMNEELKKYISVNLKEFNKRQNVNNNS